MRTDMHEVLIERPRRGWRLKSARGNKPRVGEWGRDDAYAGDYRPRRLQSKWFSDHINPLERWLRKQVGRPWDKVWSELCAGVDAGTTVGRHLLDHARWMVATHCRVAVARDRLGRCRESVVESLRPGAAEGFYVDPRTLLLRWREPSWRREQARAGRCNELFDLGGGRFRTKLQGLWYDVDAIAVERQAEAESAYDFDCNGRRWRIAAKRQLNRRALRERGLANDG